MDNTKELEVVIKKLKENEVLWKQQVLKLSITILCLTFLTSFSVAYIFKPTIISFLF